MSSNVEKIKERLSIEEVVSSYVKLDRAGKNLKGKCPFHNEKTPSFYVSPDRGGYYCFGCGAKGDIFSFVEQFEGLDFKGALKVLAEKAGVQLVYEKKNDGEKDFLFEIKDLKMIIIMMVTYLIIDLILYNVRRKKFIKELKAHI